MSLVTHPTTHPSPPPARCTFSTCPEGMPSIINPPPPSPSPFALVPSPPCLPPFARSLVPRGPRGTYRASPTRLPPSPLLSSLLPQASCRSSVPEVHCINRPVPLPSPDQLFPPSGAPHTHTNPPAPPPFAHPFVSDACQACSNPLLLPPLPWAIPPPLRPLCSLTCPRGMPSILNASPPSPSPFALATPPLPPLVITHLSQRYMPCTASMLPIS